MKSKRYVSPNGAAYEIITNGINSEMGESAIIYRELSGERKIFVCSESWWNNQGFVSPEEYIQNNITRYSSSADKIKLFMSLFIDRPDVYAKRWESKTGKCGYSPVCINEWKPSICLKSSGKCTGCTNKNYAEFDYSTIQSI